MLRRQLYSKAKFEGFFQSFPIEKWTLKSNFSPWKIIGLFWFGVFLAFLDPVKMKTTRILQSL